MAVLPASRVLVPAPRTVPVAPRTPARAGAGRPHPAHMRLRRLGKLVGRVGSVTTLAATLVVAGAVAGLVDGAPTPDLTGTTLQAPAGR